jgi:hypothetical protein
MPVFRAMRIRRGSSRIVAVCRGSSRAAFRSLMLVLTGRHSRQIRQGRNGIPLGAGGLPTRRWLDRQNLNTRILRPKGLHPQIPAKRQSHRNRSHRRARRRAAADTAGASSRTPQGPVHGAVTHSVFRRSPNDRLTRCVRPTRRLRRNGSRFRAVRAPKTSSNSAA